MFIKLTKLDNSPIWLNASFIVTVEPRKGGGSIVVPIGDGLDYEVREKAEAVLALLDGAPQPVVVPVPTSDCLTQTPDDVSPEPAAPEHEAPAPIERAPEVAAEPIAAGERVESATAEEKPAARKTTRKTATKAKPRKRATKKTPLPLDEAQVERLKKLAPRSTQKLANTLVSQFKIEDTATTIQALAEHEVLKLEGDHVIWS